MAPPESAAASRPLVVDLDGTLVSSDLQVESVFALLKRNILFAFVLPLWLLRGRARLKQQIAERIDVDPHLLPYHDSFLEYLRDEHSRGRRLILATASNEKYARVIASHLGIFDRVLASDADVNLAGERKLARLLELYGERGFDYAGNAMVDLPL